MADDEIKKVEVPLKLLTEMQEKMADMERKMADGEAKTAGLEEMLEKTAKAGSDGELKKKKNFEPKFRTVRVRKFPIKGNENDLGYIVGWTTKGAYQEVDRTGVSPQIVDYLDVIFLGHEKNKEGKPQAEKLKLLDILNLGQQIHCKILETKKEIKEIPTGEEIDVTVWDPQHGLVATGDKIDGFTGLASIQYKIQIPGVDEPVWIDSKFCNA